MLATGLTKAVLVASATLTLASCASMTVSSGVECRIFRPISWDDKDTDPTIRQVKSHNAAGVGACGWKP